MSEIREHALAAGAARAHVIDARDEFARDFVLPSLKAGALSDTRYPMATALTRPLIAKTLVQIAGIENAAHVGARRKRSRSPSAGAAQARALDHVPGRETNGERSDNHPRAILRQNHKTKIKRTGKYFRARYRANRTRHNNCETNLR